MNIVMFTNTYLPHVGGVARSVDFFARDLRRIGHSVLVVSPHFDGDTKDDPHVLRVPAIQNFNGSDFSVRIPLPFVIEEAIEAFAPDIIHSHHPFLMGDTALRVARKYNLPLVFTHHTMYEQYTHYVPLDSEVLRQFVINMVKLYTEFCNRVVAPSRSIAEILKSRGVQTPIVEIPSGVDTGAFAKGNGSAFRKAYGIPLEAAVIGYIGRLAPEKNLPYLAKAAAACLNMLPEAYFLVTGDGPSASEIETIFEQAGLTERLVMTGERSGDDLIAAYHALDLFAFASHSETQGMVLVEAMAAGVPVVALDASGAREVVEDEVNGRLLPADTTLEAFARRLAACFENEAQKNQWRAAARKTARRFSRAACADRMAQLYTNLLKGWDAQGASDDDLSVLDALMERLRTEWDLLAQKTQAVVEVVQQRSEGSYISSKEST